MPGKLKVLIITERFFPEEFIINDLAVEWVARDIQVDVLTQVPSYPFGRVYKGYSNRIFSSEQWKGMHVFRFFTITGYRNSLFFKLLNYLSFAVTGTFAALFKARGYDRIFVYHTGPLTLAIPAVIAGKLYGIPVTIWTQDIWPDMVYAYGFRKTRALEWFLGGLVRFVYRGCDTILLSCDGFRKCLFPYTGDREMTHCPNWPTVTPMPGQARKLSDKFNFTFAGNIGKFQNLDNIIRAFSMVSAGNDDVQLNIVGDGSELETLKEIVRAEGVKGVMFWGRNPQAEMPGFFSGSDVMIVSLSKAPIFELTVPAKFQAYLAFSKPVFSVMDGEVRSVVEKSGAGLCASPDDIPAIRAGFEKFYSMRGKPLSELAGRSAELVATIYNRRLIINRITDSLRSSGHSK